MATETKTFYPQAHTDVTGCEVLDAGRAVGKDSTSTSGYSSVRSNDDGYCFWPFDVSSIPLNAEVNSVACKARGLVSSSSGTCYFQLYSGTTAKGSPSVVNSTNSKGSVYTLSVGTWTREELSSVRLRTRVKASSGSKLLGFFGADLTVTYTYQSEKFMLKLGGAWHDVARVFKKVNGIWVEQESLEGVVDTSKKLVNGGEIN